MTITVKYFATFCLETNFTQQEELTIEEDTTVIELIELLTARYGTGFEKRLFTAEKELDPLCWIIVNQQRLKEKNDFQLKLNPGDTISFSPPMLMGG
ncbi:MoaD/ThiS family protein [Natroniella sulfidigena]|uniref:MoaD/ThiS family protein n=1 Tax=Natroniella sulfidigena TaxID=723921 RepID=UPI00200B5411|nr:MoaD/ThiS family protein [Natroniella sulfidigena]MCK8816874.1 MoaD/ThiS family protein [Natroniella sulfidigena]